VAAIIDDDVGLAEFGDDRVEELRVGLVADADRDLVFLIGGANLPNVYADDLGERAKILLPEL
jgi:hypothetical protein